MKTPAASVDTTARQRSSLIRIGGLVEQGSLRKTEGGLRVHFAITDLRNRVEVTYRGILRLMSQGVEAAGEPVPISSIMQTELATVRPETATVEAARLMKDLRVGCLPVVDGDQLVGIITEHDLMRIAWPLLERHLDGPSADS